MVMRCTNPKDPSFDRYGGRGIQVCDRWRRGDGEKGGFECFLDDMGLRPAGLTIERQDTEGAYEPGNCRWATRKEQARNRWNSLVITYGGETLPIAEWSARTGIKRAALHARVFRYGWPIARALGFSSRD